MHSKPKSIRNYGIEILRMIMTFFVIIEHFYKPKNISIQKITIRLRFHVPIFLILKRLLIPYLFYPIIIFIVYNFLCIFFHFEELRKSLYQLIIQYIVGRSLCSVL